MHLSHSSTSHSSADVVLTLFSQCDQLMFFLEGVDLPRQIAGLLRHNSPAA